MTTLPRTVRCSHVTVVYHRTLSSWTVVDIPGRPTSTTSTLHLREQFTSPPGHTKDTTGRRLWPTARPLLQWILQHEKTKTRQTKPIVLELGAGCGLVGMGLASSGDFERIILTDASTEWLQPNVDKNRSQFSCPVDVLALQWGKRQDHDALRTYLKTKWLENDASSASWHDKKDQSHQSSPASSEWNDNGLVAFDYIVGSDLLYNPFSQKDLVQTVGAFASKSTCTLLAVPQRLDNESSFRILAEEYGFSVKVSPLPMPNQHHERRFQKHVLLTLVQE
jgi:predicted nicotinamide N-methyase